MERSPVLTTGLIFLLSRAAAFLVCAAIVAGCGGGATGAVPNGSIQSESATRITESVPSIPATLYVSGQGSVYAYPLTARNDDPPTAVLAGEYSAANNTAIAGIATDRKGTLSILTNYGGTEGPHSPSCHVLRYPFGAPTGSIPTVASQCAADVFAGLGIISAANGEIDVWEETSPEGIATQLERFLPGSRTPYSALAPLRAPKVAPPTTFVGIAAGAAGNFYLSYNTSGGPSVQKFLGTSTSPLNPVKNKISAPISYLATAIAAGRGTVWNSVVDSSGNGLIEMAASGTVFFLTDIPLPANIRVTAMACDAGGNLYVGYATATGTGLLVYDAAGINLLGVLNNPVRRGNPAGAIITGIAIAQ